VGRYKDRVKFWEIGQEGISAPGKYETIRYTYQWIKEVDPNAQVLVTSPAGDDEAILDKGLGVLDSMLEKGLGDYFDIANLHYYETINGDFEGKNENAFDKYKAVLDKHGIKKPIWVTETSTSSEGTSVLSGRSSPARQAQDVVKRLVIFSAKGAERVFWFDYRQTSPEDKFFGCNLVDAKTEPKPAYYTFKLLVDKIGSYARVNTLRRDGVWLYRFTDAKGSSVFVAWASSPTTVDLKSELGTDEVTVTHIVEDTGSQARKERMESAKVRLSPSPLFLE